MSSNLSIVSEVRRVLLNEGQAILDCLGRLEGERAQAIERALARMEQALNQGGKIVLTGVGKSGKVAQKIAATFSSTGSLAVYLHPTEGLHGDLGLVAPHDVVLALSYTGNTEELLKLVPSLKLLNVPVIGMGGNAKSRLAGQCDEWIDASVSEEACPFNLAPTTSTTLALALGDALALALMKLRKFDARGFAANHPGGALGNRLNMRVSDIMHHGEQIATLPESASMDEVVVATTNKRLGVVLIVSGAKLLGIVTDGDLRRALQHKEKFFKLTAGEVMTRSPITIQESEFAAAALELMENRPYQISVLPVVDAAGHWKGLVRIHDLIQVF
jgi:arabinose-5-phosphate isomerase